MFNGTELVRYSMLNSFGSDFITFAAVDSGVPIQTIVLILIIPVIVTIIAFFRQVIGIKAFGIYTPALVTFAFLDIGSKAESFWRGLKYGIFLFILILVVGIIARALLRKLKMLYLPRMAIIITLVAVATLFFLIVSGYSQRTGMASVSIFPIVIMITLVEKFVATYIEKGVRQATILSLETLIISVACYFVLGWGDLLVFVQKFPWVVLFTIPINIILGRWTGLRLTEYFRFKDIIKNAEIPYKK
ncbi:MAG TPA: hypothetical protein GX706_03105 [Candidatus Moranbacteria bacterium]|nr:hypothetical protein [Candidatus Moranbacteria bacterium]